MRFQKATALRWVAAGVVALALGCGSSESKTLLVSAASDLQEASAALGEQFFNETGVRVRFNFGASGMLVQQIEAGAKADVFASADVDFVTRLQRGGFVAEGSSRVYAKGRLAVVTAKGLPKLQTLDDLKRPEFTRIAVANPVTAPYGAAAKEAVAAAGLSDALQPKLIIAENVRQALQYVQLGEVDAAFVSASLIGGMQDATLLVPDKLHRPLLQAAAPLASSKKPQEAARFVEFLVGESGRAIFDMNGFEPPPESAKP